MNMQEMQEMMERGFVLRLAHHGILENENHRQELLEEFKSDRTESGYGDTERNAMFAGFILAIKLGYQMWSDAQDQNAQLVKLAEMVSQLNPKAGEIGDGMLANLVAQANLALGKD